MIVLGIDPGSRQAGYAIVEVEGREERLLDVGTLRFDTSTPHALRLREVYRRVSEIVEEHMPDECAIEMPVYGKNPQSMLKLGRAQAAAMLAPLNREIPVSEYTPKQVKKSVTGNGNASKQQVQYMVCSMLDGAEAGALSHDASDALAVALCHVHRRSERSTERHTDWAAFVDANPDRVG